MALVKCSKEKTPYELPCVIVNDFGSFIQSIRYYDNESLLLRAYKQLITINGKIKPFSPIVYGKPVYYL